MTSASDNPVNSLGLDFDQIKLQDSVESSETSTAPTSETQQTTSDQNAVAKKKPYVNPERVKTGGSQRDKLTEEELSERMARMREQNEKIKQRRLDVQADEDAFKKTQDFERARIAQNRRVQEDRTREQNAKRKMDKVQMREWDSGKPTPASKGARPPMESRKAEETPEEPESTSPATPFVSRTAESGQWSRGGVSRGSPRGGRGTRGRGRGQQRGGAPNGTTTSDSPTAPELGNDIKELTPRT
ncbi:unnamed protein product [Mycena citricolor]|uniref:Uncharacterized protein n=1 Tax=Mycena citricolor TaxID=2018698 RepID=A0AAD2HPZ7_9AGAR|nr:unnamed protein product [Mycena citricolor]